MQNQNRTFGMTPKVFNPHDFRNGPKQKPLISIKFLIILIFVILLFGAAIYFLYYSSFFVIKNIIIENSQNSQLAGELEKLKGKNILFFNSKNYVNELSVKYPEVVNVKILRGLPDTIRVQFSERQSKIIWQTNNQNYLVDAQGIIYEKIETANDLPLIIDNKNLQVSIGQGVVSQNFIKFITELNSTFKDKIGFNITGFQVSDTIFQVEAFTDQKWKIIFDSNRTAADQLAQLSQFISTNKDEIKDYVDLRVEGRVYYI